MIVKRICNIKRAKLCLVIGVKVCNLTHCMYSFVHNWVILLPKLRMQFAAENLLLIAKNFEKDRINKIENTVDQTH